MADKLELLETVVFHVQVRSRAACMHAHACMLLETVVFHVPARREAEHVPWERALSTGPEHAPRARDLST